MKSTNVPVYQNTQQIRYVISCSSVLCNLEFNHDHFTLISSTLIFLAKLVYKKKNIEMKQLNGGLYDGYHMLYTKVYHERTIF